MRCKAMFATYVRSIHAASRSCGLFLATLLVALLSAQQAHAFQTGIDLNTYKSAYGTSASTFQLFQGDFVYTITVNSDLSDAQWQTAFTTLQGPNNWIVSEDNPPTSTYFDNRSYVRILNIMGHVADRMCYNETGSTPGGTLLSDSQISSEASTHGGQVAVLTRDYNTTWQAWRTETDRCIANPTVTAVIMETASSYASQKCADLVTAVLKANKRVYFLLPATNTAYALSSLNYLLQTIPTQMASPNVYVIIYNYSGGSWFGGTNTSQGTLSQCRALEVINPPTVATPASATPNPVASVSTNVSVLGDDVTGEENLNYIWSATGPAPVSFSAGGTNAAKNAVATFKQAGTYTLTASITDGQNAAVTSSVSVVVGQVPGTTVTPTVSSIPDGQTQQMTATATDQFGAALSQQPGFTWALDAPALGSISSTGLYTAPAAGTGSDTVRATGGGYSGTATVIFGAAIIANGSFETPSVGTATYTYRPTGAAWTFTGSGGIQSNGSIWSAATAPDGVQTAFLQGSGSAAQSVSFASAGTYQVNFQAAQRPGQVQPVQIKIDGTAVGAAITPASSAFQPYSSATFTINAPGTHTITMAGTHTNDVTTFVDQVGISTVLSTALSASASPNPVNGTTTTLSVLGTDASGESTLTYTWATTGTPPAPVNFSANGTNAAKSTIATFSQPGVYNFQVTITDGNGLTTTSTTAVTVNQTPKTVLVSPMSATVLTNGMKSFTASVADQFGSTLTSPAVTWSVSAGSGTIDAASGVYTAPSTPGNATVQAACGAASGTAAVTINQTPPSAPLSANATPGNTAVVLSWNAPANGPVTSYNLYRGTASGGEGTMPIATGISGSPYTDGGLTNGQTYFYQISAVNVGGEGPRSSEVSATPVNLPPTVATPASATPNPVTGTSTHLSVLGGDDQGEGGLTYTWATTGAPPAAVTFSSNGSNAAKSTTATFTQAGSYTFQVTITDGGGLSTTNSVTVGVNQSLTTVSVTPGTASVPTGQTQQFTAAAADQFGMPMSPQPAFTWTLDTGGVGTVSNAGLYAAPTTGAGSATVRATSGSVSGMAAVTSSPTAPVLSGISPTAVPAKSPTFTLTVTGANFFPNSVVNWNGTALTTTFVSSTQMTASVPASLVVSAGTASITVTTPQTASSGSKTFTINAVSGITVQSLSLSPTSVKGGSATSTGTITLTGPAPAGGLAVKQTSSDTSAATLAPTLNIPAGATSAKFKITTYAAAGTKTVTITSSANGTSKTAVLTVIGTAPPITVLSLSLSPTSVKGGSATSTGTITLSGPAPAGGVAVKQTSSDTSAATLAPTLNIPAGANSAKFKITTLAVGSTKTVTITSALNGTSKTATLTVTH